MSEQSVEAEWVRCPHPELQQVYHIGGNDGHVLVDCDLCHGPTRVESCPADLARTAKRDSSRVGRDDDGAIDEIVIADATFVHAEMMSESEIMIFTSRIPCGPKWTIPRTGRLSVWAKRGRWPWSAPVLGRLYEDEY